jgi:predicted ester cyclase
MLTERYRTWLFEVWGKGDESAAAEVLAEDLVDHDALPGQPAGRAGDLWAAQAVRNAFPDLSFELDVCFEQGDLVSGRWTMRGTHTGTFELMGIPPTGRPVVMHGQEIFRADADGRFVEVWHQEGVGAMLSQLGLDPPRRMLAMAARRSARRYRKGR